MKRAITLLLTLSLLAALPVFAQAADRVVGTIYHTDIVAQIDGAQIPSYNIDGSTGVVAEDLADYGFDVHWDASARRLDIAPNGAAFTASCQPAPNTHRVGSVAGKVYATDIKTYLLGAEVPSYNIGGSTVILMDSLQTCGGVFWDASERTISLTTAQSWTAKLYEPDCEADVSAPIASVSLTAVRNEDGTFTTTGENLDYLDDLTLSYDRQNGLRFKVSLYQRTMSETGDLSRLLHAMKMVDYEGITYVETADEANLHMEVLVNGEAIPVTLVRHMVGNGHSDFIFTLDWYQSEVETFSITCKP